MSPPLQPLQLIIYHSPLFAAHWALFLPTPSCPKTGKRIHADGSPLTGFEVLFEPFYDLRECSQSYQIIELGQVKEEDVERVASETPAPAKSLVSALEASGTRTRTGVRRRIEVRNCQSWVVDVVGRLVGCGGIGEEAFLIVGNAPKN
ncbi:hypothetical protein K491DRAFT_471379 [Lophiostoma macrostomum CBS 122681]|uniref:Uncharacterized protein n=1 Tax=Lophiostoma macrostomum CBS 122681 TaxID=1314788 RepID=A0A6A6T2V5_9PLEO|nr:hypothetical protein K491DRAFT_471379 [Lophiostoma macrostomum CBS 122681]